MPALESAAARATVREAGGGEPLLLNDWTNVLFIHLRVPPDALQPIIPFALDLHDGAAWVSLVAFRLERLRLAWRGGALERLCSPVSGHGFLNVRTYVREGDEPGIYFIREWVDRRLSVLLGPLLFDLPYRFAALRHEHDPRTGALLGGVEPPDGGGRLRWRGRTDPGSAPAPCVPGSRDEFLLERYSAFTCRRGRRRRFRVGHDPWLQVPAAVELEETELLRGLGAWAAGAEPAGAHHSRGAFNVGIGRPLLLP